MQKENRNYKDTVFVDLFGKCAQAKENFLSLYNAIHNTHLRLSETEIKPVMLERTVYVGRYNDVSMLLNGRIIVLVEQQSTINENMPLRFLEYVSRLYEKIIPQDDRYKQKLIPIPAPKFYVFYNGATDYPAEKTLRISDAFGSSCTKKSEFFPLELTVKVYNINKQDDTFLRQHCASLYGYKKLVQYAREAKNAGTENHLDFAIARCIKEGILSDYLKQNSTEVRNMLIADYDYETDIRVKRQESFSDGFSQGIACGLAQQKAEDEKLLFEERELRSKKEAEIAELKAQIAKLLQK